MAAMVLAGERKLSDLTGQEMETKPMAEGERDKNDEDKTVTMKEGKTERGNAMRGERKKSLVGERTEGERGEKVPMEEGRRGETEGETAQRKEAERKEEEIETERGTEIGGIEIEIGTEEEEKREDNIQSVKTDISCTFYTIRVLNFLLIIGIQ